MCLPCIAVLSSFGRETSLVNIMGPRSILPPLFTPSIYFLFLLSVAATITFLPLCLILCKQQGRRDWQPLCTRWEQSYLFLCAGPGEVSNLGSIVHFTTFLDPSESYGRQTLVSLPRENLPLHYISPCTWFNQRGLRVLTLSCHQQVFWRRCRGLQ